MSPILLEERTSCTARDEDNEDEDDRSTLPYASDREDDGTASLGTGSPCRHELKEVKVEPLQRVSHDAEAYSNNSSANPSESLSFLVKLLEPIKYKKSNVNSVPYHSPASSHSSRIDRVAIKKEDNVANHLVDESGRNISSVRQSSSHESLGNNEANVLCWLSSLQECPPSNDFCKPSLFGGDLNGRNPDSPACTPETKRSVDSETSSNHKQTRMSPTSEGNSKMSMRSLRQKSSNVLNNEPKRLKISAEKGTCTGCCRGTNDAFHELCAVCSLNLISAIKAKVRKRDKTKRSNSDEIVKLCTASTHPTREISDSELVDDLLKYALQQTNSKTEEMKSSAPLKEPTENKSLNKISSDVDLSCYSSLRSSVNSVDAPSATTFLISKESPEGDPKVERASTRCARDETCPQDSVYSVTGNSDVQGQDSFTSFCESLIQRISKNLEGIIGLPSVRLSYTTCVMDRLINSCSNLKEVSVESLFGLAKDHLEWNESLDTHPDEVTALHVLTEAAYGVACSTEKEIIRILKTYFINDGEEMYDSRFPDTVLLSDIRTSSLTSKQHLPPGMQSGHQPVTSQNQSWSLLVNDDSKRESSQTVAGNLSGTDVKEGITDIQEKARNGEESFKTTKVEISSRTDLVERDKDDHKELEDYFSNTITRLHPRIDKVPDVPLSDHRALSSVAKVTSSGHPIQNETSPFHSGAFDDWVKATVLQRSQKKIKCEPVSPNSATYNSSASSVSLQQRSDPQYFTKIDPREPSANNLYPPSQPNYVPQQNFTYVARVIPPDPVPSTNYSQNNHAWQTTPQRGQFLPPPFSVPIIENSNYGNDQICTESTPHSNSPVASANFRQHDRTGMPSSDLNSCNPGVSPWWSHQHQSLGFSSNSSAFEDQGSSHHPVKTECFWRCY